VRFAETRTFTRAVRRLLSDDDYRTLQLALALRPEQGPIIKGSGGLRKVRAGLAGRGKSGGVRIIYYWDKSQELFYMLFAYPKNVQEDPTREQLRILSRLVREEFK
jgi:mRNA-degrading endonuclease RelE of RelBE toxin-antitoxin system